MLIPVMAIYLLSIPASYTVGKIYTNNHLPDTTEEEMKLMLRVLCAVLPPVAAILSAQILIQMENQK